MVWVISSKYLSDYKVFVQFNDGNSGVIDFHNKLLNDHRVIVKELLDLEIFKTVKTKLDTICWDNGLDFAPEYLYEQLKFQKAA